MFCATNSIHLTEFYAHNPRQTAFRRHSWIYLIPNTCLTIRAWQCFNRKESLNITWRRWRVVRVVLPAEREDQDLSRRRCPWRWSWPACCRPCARSPAPAAVRTAPTPKHKPCLSSSGVIEETVSKCHRTPQRRRNPTAPHWGCQQRSWLSAQSTL